MDETMRAFKELKVIRPLWS